MQRKNKYIPVLIIIFGLLPPIFLEAGCAKKKATPFSKKEEGLKKPAEEFPAQGIAQKILSFNLEGYRDNGEKKWELSGACADILSNVIKLDYVTAKAYGEEASLTLTADRGVYDKNTKDIHLQKNVIGRSSDGTRLVTDSLDWNQKAERVTTDALVKIEKDNLFSVGKGAVGTPGLRQVELKKDITVEIREDPPNPPTIITCDGPLVVDYKKNISTLNKNVKISDPRGEIYSDIMKIRFDPNTRKITRVIAIGNVKIQREGNATYSDRAIYSVKDGKVRLVGKPKIVVYPKEKKDASVGDKGAS